MNDKQKIEQLLKNYRQIKSNIQIELTKEYPEFALDSVSFIKMSGKQSYSGTSQQERYVLNKYDISEDLQNQIIVRDIIRVAYESLPVELRRVVVNYYFENKGVKGTAVQMGWSEDTIRRRKEDILINLKKAGILKAWEIWRGIRV